MIVSEINETKNLEKSAKKAKKSKISLILVLVLSIGATILSLNLIQLAVVATGLEIQVKEDDEVVEYYTEDAKTEEVLGYKSLDEITNKYIAGAQSI